MFNSGNVNCEQYDSGMSRPVIFEHDFTTHRCIFVPGWGAKLDKANVSRPRDHVFCKESRNHLHLRPSAIRSAALDDLSGNLKSLKEGRQALEVGRLTVYRSYYIKNNQQKSS